ncbi:MAG: hypothetical protein B6D63_01780 [Candidatus Latescibacteria bacterium 4484_7]|nr:MAG: hypothetical protein B6D63_01780 [Candidatus Latescibacteria bacterium 4484_7]
MPEFEEPISLTSAPKVIKKEASRGGETLFAICAKSDKLFLVPVKHVECECISFSPSDIAKACKNHGMLPVGTLHTHPCSDDLCVLPSGEDIFYYAKVSDELPLFCIASKNEFVCYYRGDGDDFQEAFGSLKELPSKIEVVKK